MTLSNTTIKCSNFKCFGKSAYGFEGVKPINVIIGRNNSGKTTLLDLIEYATSPAPLHDRGHGGQPPSVVLEFVLSKELFGKHVSDSQEHLNEPGFQWSFHPRRWGETQLAGKTLGLELEHNGDHSFAYIHGFVDHTDEAVARRNRRQAEWVCNQFRNALKNPFKGLEFRRISAERDISAETSDQKISIASNGVGATNAIQRYINDETLDRDLIEKVLLQELNLVFGPDANYTRLLVQQKTNTAWEIFLEEPKKGRIRMSHTGSGLKTVLLVLANLLLVPRLGKNPRPLSEFVFGFEELENNLHPAIQRRLFRYLRDTAIRENCHFFITTHSNVVIDLFSHDNHAQLIHVTHNGEYAEAKKVSTIFQGSAILDDLDIRASDILQTNAVVWVEGPSDRIYFNKWIELWSDGKLVEGIHYQCLPFGGSCNAHLSLASPEEVNNLIAAIRINRNAILLADSDRQVASDSLKKHTARLADEISERGYAWITGGREVENYIPVKTFQKIYANDKLTGPGLFTDVLEYVASHDKKSPPAKTELAHRIIEHLSKETLAETLDMSEQLDKVCALIQQWNRIPEPLPTAA